MNTTFIVLKASMIMAAALLLGACGAGGSGEPFGGNKSGGSTAQTSAALADAPEQVQTIYKQSCISCHGNDLEGKVGPSTNLQKAGAKLSKEQIAKQIASGGGGMPAFGSKLKPEEVEAIASWLAAKK